MLSVIVGVLYFNKYYLLCMLEHSNDVVYYFFSICGIYCASPVLFLKHRKGFLEAGKMYRYHVVQ